MTKRIGDALIEHGRAIEWLTSIGLLMFAITLAMPGNTLDSPGFGAFVRAGFDEASLAVPLALIAAGRLVALYINGNWRRTPLLRMIGAVIGAGVFAVLSMAFAWPTLEGTRTSLSTGVLMYLTLSAFDGLAAYRSGADVRLAHR